MSKFFAELLTPTIVILNTKRLENEQIMIQKPRKLLQVGNIQNFGPLKFSLDPLNLDFAVLKGSGKIQLDPLNFWVRATPGLNY